jgi:predicted PurR-regulated permease PerM
MPTLHGRFRRRDRGRGDGADGDLFEIDTAGLSDLFAAPGWLRDAGLTSWLLVGITLLLGGLVWLASLTSVILVPVIAASMIAAVAGPLVTWMEGHHLPRALGAIIVLVLIAAAGSFAGWLILRGLVTEADAISGNLESAVGDIEGWLKDLGVSDGKSQSAGAGLKSGASDSFDALKNGLVGGIEALSSLVFFLAMTALSLVFLLKDGPSIRAWAESHSGVATPVAHIVSGRTLESLRGYFLGVTIVAIFNAILVGGGALLLGVPLAGTIAVVTFIGAYIPYIGAWSAGAFSVLIALGGGSPEAASGMIAIQILSNGPLQQIVQPIAYGAALGIHPLAVLIVTIAGGALFGAVGLILAAPVTSAIVRISADLGRASREEAAAEGGAGERPSGEPPPQPAPG